MTTLYKSNHVTVTFVQGVTPADPDWTSLQLLDSGWVVFLYDEGYRRRYSPSTILHISYSN